MTNNVVSPARQSYSAETLRHLLTADKSFVPSLNGLRAVSIGIVLMDHAIPIKIIPGGFGVSVFFFISGFLITRLLLAEYRETGGIDLRRFYISRAFRLFPPLLVALAVALIVTYMIGYEQSALAISSVLFYFANYVHGIDNSVLKTIAMYHAWSLAVEEHFYLLFPVLMLAALPHRTRPYLVVLAAIGLAAILRIIYHLAFPEAASAYIYTATETRMDFIAYGCLAALICNSRYAARFIGCVSSPAIFLAGAGMILVSLVVREHFFRDTIRYYLQGVGLFILIPAILFGRHYAGLRGALNLPLIDWIGRLSYSLYLFHPVCLILGAYWIERAFNLSPVVAEAAGVGIGLSMAMLAACLSYYLIEQPSLRLRKIVLSQRRMPRSAPA